MAALRVIEVPSGARWRDHLAAAGLTGSDDLVLVVPAGRHRLLVAPDDNAAALGSTGAAAVRSRSDVAALGPLRVLLDLDADLVVDERGLLIHEIERGTSEVVVINGRVRNGRTSTDPLVAVGPPDALSWLDELRTDPGARDLAAVLRYEGATTTSVEWQEVAPDVLLLSFWPPAFCGAVIRAAEAVGAFGPQDDDPVPGNEVSLGLISPRLFAHLEDDLLVRAMPIVNEVWPLAEYHGLRDAFVITYAPGAQEELRTHHDVAQVSGSIKLNDGYRGGELWFPRQGFDNADVPVGSLLLWPSLVTHPHGARPILDGVKYNLTIWFELPGGQRTA